MGSVSCNEEQDGKATAGSVGVMVHPLEHTEHQAIDSIQNFGPTA